MIPVRSKIFGKSADSRPANRTSNGVIKIRLILACILSTLTLSLALAPAAGAFDVLNQTCTPAQNADQTAICQNAKSTGTNNPITSGNNGILPKTARVLALIVGIGAVITIIVGGFNYVTAAGNPEKSARAKARLTYAVVGLIVALLAWALTAFFTHRLLQ